MLFVGYTQVWHKATILVQYLHYFNTFLVLSTDHRTTPEVLNQGRIISSGEDLRVFSYFFLQNLKPITNVKTTKSNID